MDSYHQDKSAETPQRGHSHGDRERRKPAVEVKVEEENTDPLYPPPSPLPTAPHRIQFCGSSLNGGVDGIVMNRSRCSQARRMGPIKLR